MFGDRLKELREDMGLTQEQLSIRLDITRQQLSNYETNKYQPSFDILIRISDFFNVSLDYLLCRTKQKENIIIDNEIILEVLNDRNKKKIVIELCKSLNDFKITKKDSY